jgi:site-specific recombinase XerD
MESIEAREVKGVDLEVRRFDEYMLNTVGLQDATRLYRRRYVREFLDEFFPDRDVDVSGLTPESLVSYLSKRGSRLKPASTKVLASSVRSYFRFLRLHGRCEEDLVHAVPASASWRLASLPPALTDEEIARLLSAFDRGSAAGRRDYAITRCLVDLGLRAREVVRLRLEDVDWRKGILRIIGTKSRRDDELPLTAPIGAAIAAYIRRGRPKTTSREIFLRLRAPVGQRMTRSTIGNLLLRAATRARMEPKVTGPRILRHTAATRMLQRGASMKEIADVLRHRCLDTTAIYTKVDLPHLTTVALPWPIKGDQ